MKNTKKVYKAVSWTLVLLWMGFIFLLSHQPASESSQLSTSLLSYLMEKGSEILPGEEMRGTLHHLLRKGAHFSAYFVLGALILNAILSTKQRFRWRYVVLAFILSVFYAMSDEYHQLFVPGRSGEWKDVLIDSSGSSLGVLSFWLVKKALRKEPRKRIRNVSDSKK